MDPYSGRIISDTDLEDLRRIKPDVMTTPIIAAAQALDGLLRAAEDGDLPLPFSAEVSVYAPHGHPAYDDTAQFAQGGITFQVADLAALTEWATWLDSTLRENDAPYKGNLHTHADGYAGPIPVRVTALVPVTEQVSA